MFATGYPFKTYNFRNSTGFFNVYGEMRFVELLLNKKFHILMYDSDGFCSKALIKKTNFSNVNNIVYPDYFRVHVVAEEFRNKTFEEVGNTAS